MMRSCRAGRWVVHVLVLSAIALTVPLVRVPPARAALCDANPGAHVSIVLDFGSAPGAPDGVLNQCVALTAAMTGMGALRALSGSIGTDASGKVCQIDGVPATYDPSNCSSPVNGTTSYWAYFHGQANGWVYSSVGAGGWRVQPTTVEGWRFVRVPVGTTETPVPRDIQGVGPSYLWQTTCPTDSPSNGATTIPGAPGTTNSQSAFPGQNDGEASPIPTAQASPMTSALQGSTTVSGATSVPQPLSHPNASSPFGHAESGIAKKAGASAKRVTQHDVTRALDHAQANKGNHLGAWLALGGIFAIMGITLWRLRSRGRAEQRR